MHARTHERTHTHTHTFNGLLSRTTRVSRYQKGKTNLDLTEAIDSEWQWHQLDHMQVCTSLQTDNHASTPPLSFLQTFLPPNQQRQSTEGKALKAKLCIKLDYKSKKLNITQRNQEVKHNTECITQANMHVLMGSSLVYYIWKNLVLKKSPIPDQWQWRQTQWCQCRRRTSPETAGQFLKLDIRNIL